ncbi:MULTISPECIES: hypothetical protein [unclassified Neglectibacter]|uniref:hypothetical protein n=1 Tax=unclassified Neglectibacter TaxID=2632164 RepID=UPI001EF10BD2|nr:MULTISPECIES: hypothetical protein [unclassified Neglectibacter]
MKVKYIRSDGVYQKIANASIEKKNDIYRYELMMPFKKKWDCYSVPMKASTPNGYDVIIVEATLLPASEILEVAEDFWNE